MCLLGQVIERLLKQEIARRARVNRVKDTLDCCYDVRHSAQVVADWFCYKSGLEYRRGNDDESKWFRWKCGIIRDFQDECNESRTRLFRRFKQDLMRDVQYPSRS